MPDTRFKSGNPGRPKGARGKRTLLADVLSKADELAVRKAVIDAAVGGDMVACRLVWDRIFPVKSQSEQDLERQLEELQERLEALTRQPRLAA